MLPEADPSIAMPWTAYRFAITGRLAGAAPSFAAPLGGVIDALRDASTLQWLAQVPSISVHDMYRVARERL
jgi:hypothetical protein